MPGNGPGFYNSGKLIVFLIDFKFHSFRNWLINVKVDVLISLLYGFYMSSHKLLDITAINDRFVKCDFNLHWHIP